jgi:uncharacterized protein (DUF983 family)
MNGKQIIILIIGLAVLGVIAWNDLPLEFPGAMIKMLLLFVKAFVVLALTVVACVFAGRKKKPS